MQVTWRIGRSCLMWLKISKVSFSTHIR